MSEQLPPPDELALDAEPPDVRLKPRWIAWFAVSILLPVVPWLVTSEDDKKAMALLVATIFAVICQIAISVYLARGIAHNLHYRFRGRLVLHALLMLGSVAMGTLVWSLGFMVFIMKVYDKAGH